MKAVFSHNSWLQNYYGHVYLNGYGSAAFDHNRLQGSGYQGIQLYGFNNSQVSLRGDSIAIANDYWLYTNRFDSLAMDSVSVLASYSADINGGRIAVIRNSQFQLTNYYGLSVDASPRTSGQLVLRNLIFRGVKECDECADGVTSYNMSVDADSITAENMNYV